MRIFEPEANKENMASYYENLYKRAEVQHHPYHDLVTAKLREYEHDLSYENEQINVVPDISEVKNTIEKLKNKKATSDINKVDRPKSRAFM